MKIPKQIRGSIIEIAAKIFAGGIKRDVSAILVKFDADELKIFEKKGSKSPSQTSYVAPRLGLAIIARLKIMGGMLIGEHHKVQVGSHNFQFDGMPRIGRKVRMISVPDLNGNGEIIIDLVHN